VCCGLTACGKQGGDGSAIGHGEEVNLDEHVVTGKTTIVDFYSEFCPPCKALSPKLEALAEKRDDIALVKVDINRSGKQGIDWSSPVAKQFGLKSVPFLMVFGPDGKEQSRGDAARATVEGWLR
jgi:thioredoxin 1